MSNFLGSVQPTGGLEIFSLKGYRISLLRTFSTPSKRSFLCRTDCMKTGAKFTPPVKTNHDILVLKSLKNNVVFIADGISMPEFEKWVTDHRNKNPYYWIP